MAKSKTNGNCYICGMEAKKTVMKNHILKMHGGGDEPCFLLAIEGADNSDYWLIVDVALDKSLSALDTFLRKIWLECCGHMSEFNRGGYGNNVGKSRKLADFMPGEKIFHIYDFGATTETRISFTAKTMRPKQRSAVRLLARNIPPQLACKECAKPAEFICCECGGMYEGAFYCTECADEHECGQDMMLPITNSPRSGECGYTGEQDNFEYKKITSVRTD